MIGVILGPTPVDAADLPLDLFLRQTGIVPAPFPAAADLAFQVRVDEDAERLTVPQNVIGAPPDDDAVRFFRKLPEDLALLPEDGLGLLEILIFREEKTPADGDRVQRMREPSLHLPDVLLCEGGPLRDLGEDLPVVILYLQFLRQTAAQLPAAAAELPANGDDFVHSGHLLFVQPLLRHDVVVGVLDPQQGDHGDNGLGEHHRPPDPLYTAHEDREQIK